MYCATIKYPFKNNVINSSSKMNNGVCCNPVEMMSDNSATKYLGS